MSNITRFFRKNPRYGVVLGIFFICILLNLLVLNPTQKSVVNSNPSSVSDDTGDRTGDVFSGIDKLHSSKIYDGVMSVQKGDWYRVGFSAKSIDRNEVLQIFSRSEFGKETKIGTVSVVNDNQEHYFDFVINADDSYRDIVFRKDSQDSISEWDGGRIDLNNLFVSRLPLTSEAQFKSLHPTFFGTPSISKQNLSFENGDISSGNGFIFGRKFVSLEDQYLLEVTLNMKYSKDASGKYRLELHEYDSDKKKIGTEVIKKNSFSLNDVGEWTDENGYVVLDFPVAVKSGETYFLGIADDDVSNVENALQILAMPQSSLQEEDGFGVLTLMKPPVSPQGNVLLTNSRLEDFGLFSRYVYKMNHRSTDFSDLYEVLGKVTYSDKIHAVVGDEKLNTSFTYKIDTLRPFSLLRLEALQIGNSRNQIRIDYSYDLSSWKEVAFTQEEKSPQVFDFVLPEKEGDRSVVFFRVSYAGNENEKGVFGLRDFQVTANVANDTKK